MSRDNLEDVWFEAAQKSNAATSKYQTLYRLRNHVYAKMVLEEINSHDKISKAAAELNVQASEEFRQYQLDMVNAQKQANDLSVVAEYKKMQYFRAKDMDKSEKQVYGYGDDYKDFIGDNQDVEQKDPTEEFEAQVGNQDEKEFEI